MPVINDVDPKKKFQADVKRLRDAGMSYSDIARKLNVHRNFVSNWAKGIGPWAITARILREQLDEILKERGLRP